MEPESYQTFLIQKANESPGGRVKATMELIGSARDHFGSTFDKEELRRAIALCYDSVKTNDGPWFVLKPNLRNH